MFYDTGTQREKALITNIPRVRDSEETILCPRVMAWNTFFPVTFFSDVKFFLKSYSTKRRSKKIKLCKKSIGHQPRFGENSQFFFLASFPARKVAIFKWPCVMHRTDAQCNTRESP